MRALRTTLPGRQARGDNRAPSPNRASVLLAGLLMAIGLALPASAQDLLIRNATVHTAGEQGTLTGSDVLVRGGRVEAIGRGLAVASGIPVVDAAGRPLTPTLFAGITGIGIAELPEEATTEDAALDMGNDPDDVSVRPEFDVTLAYNPNSIMVPLARVEGFGFTLLQADSESGGSIVGGQGATLRLDGSPSPVGPRALFITLGGKAAALSGSSRAAQWMVLDQLVEEASGRGRADSRLLTRAGQASLRKYFAGQGRIVVRVDRASDIRQLLQWSARHKLRIAIASGVEAWQLAEEIARANVPVFVDPLVNLPYNFDQLNAREDNASILRKAGVRVGFTQSYEAARNARNARKLRQLAGNAVAEGLPWEDGLAGLTRIPAETFGAGDELGTIAVGKRADLVLWTGDPLDVANTAVQVWMDGRAIPMRSRQTDLRDRYLPRAGAVGSRLPPAYRLPAMKVDGH